MGRCQERVRLGRGGKEPRGKEPQEEVKVGVGGGVGFARRQGSAVTVHKPKLEPVRRRAQCRTKSQVKVKFEVLAYHLSHGPNHRPTPPAPRESERARERERARASERASSERERERERERESERETESEQRESERARKGKRAARESERTRERACAREREREREIE